jgi:hypothetical protein
LANALVEREILDEREIEEIVGPSASQLALTNGKADAARAETTRAETVAGG